jgi:outer membrane protein OmpA-like peptidoglycan-associated protein
MRQILIILAITTISFVSSAQQDSLEPNQVLYEFDMKYFGSDFQVDPNYQYVLEHLVLLSHSDSIAHIHVRGHVCCGPSYRLSKRRARKAYKYLKRAGISKTKLSYKGYSDSKPLRWPEEEPEDEAANRRVDFVLTIRK